MNEKTNILISSFQEYLQVIKYSKSSVENYVGSLKTFFDFLSFLPVRGTQTGNCKEDVRAVAKQDIKDYLQYLLSQNYTMNTVHAKYKAVCRLFEYLEKTNQILINPTSGIPAPSLGKRLPKNILTKEEVKKILNAPNTSTLVGIRDKTILEVFYSTGIRLEELCNLTVFDIDLQSGYLRVNKGKGAKDRVVPLGKVAAQYLKEYIEKVRPAFTKKNRDERYLFVGKMGKKINKLIVERTVKEYAKEAGIKKSVTPHTFRHTCATHMLVEDIDIIHVQKLLGHSKPSVTQIYTRVTPKEVKESHEKTHPREKDNDKGRKFNASQRTFQTAYASSKQVSTND